MPDVVATCVAMQDEASICSLPETPDRAQILELHGCNGSAIPDGHIHNVVATTDRDHKVVDLRRTVLFQTRVLEFDLATASLDDGSDRFSSRIGREQSPDG